MLIPFIHQNVFRFSIVLLLLHAPMEVARGQETSSITSTTANAVPGDRSASMIEVVEMAIVKQTNQFRHSNDLAPVERDEHLTQAAAKFAAFMAETSKYGHRANGMTPAERASRRATITASFARISLTAQIPVRSPPQA